MAKRSQVGLDIVDLSDPWRWLSVRGHVVHIAEEGATEHIDAMAKKYTGHDTYGFHRPGDVRVLCKIQPDVVHYQASPRQVNVFRPQSQIRRLVAGQPVTVSAAYLMAEAAAMMVTAWVV